MARVAGVGAVVSVLDLDSALGSGVSSEDWETARRLCRAELVGVPSGRRVLPADALGSDLVGLVIVAGLLCRELPLRDRRMLELLGLSDVVLPPVDGDRPRLGGRIALTAVLDTELLALGGSFITAAARWPCLLRSVQDRVESQRTHLAVQGLIAHLPRAEHRLLLVLHHLADRWGFVTPEGTVVPLPLSHDLLGQLAAARRSTITLALSTLHRDCLVRRLDDGSWLLTGAADELVRSIAKTSASSQPVGEMLALRARAIERSQEARALRAEARLARHRPGPNPATRQARRNRAILQHVPEVSALARTPCFGRSSRVMRPPAWGIIRVMQDDGRGRTPIARGSLERARNRVVRARTNIRASARHLSLTLNQSADALEKAAALAEAHAQRRAQAWQRNDAADERRAAERPYQAAERARLHAHEASKLAG